MQIAFAPLILAILVATPVEGRDYPTWKHLSSDAGDLPVPGTSRQQTGCLVLDIDKDGVNDIVVTSREAGASLIWYRRGQCGWTCYPIDRGINIEAGGAYLDLDGDGDLDVVFGEDYSGSKLFWWENPFPRFALNQPWTRREIKSSGGTMHHDQIFGDFAGNGTNQLAFWVQKAGILCLASLPKDPRTCGPWPVIPIASVGPGEGLAKADVDGDGKMDLIGGGYWFKHQGGTSFRPMLIDKDSLCARTSVGQLVEGAGPEVVFVVGDGVGRLKWFERLNDRWMSHDLLGEPVVHGHSLEIADIDRDGHLDIFCAEMTQWTDQAKVPDNPGARMWIFYGDGKGKFDRCLLASGIDNHESRLGDLDGDGDLDIVVKPYTHTTPRLDVWLNQGAGVLEKTTHLMRAAKPIAGTVTGGLECP